MYIKKQIINIIYNYKEKKKKEENNKKNSI